MNRKLVTEKELVSFLNAELKKTGQFGGCLFDSIVRLRVDDRTGCNWASAKLKGLPQVDDACPPIAEQIVTRARSEFNLK